VWKKWRDEGQGIRQIHLNYARIDARRIDAGGWHVLLSKKQDPVVTPSSSTQQYWPITVVLKMLPLLLWLPL
jgi:hypothetical protein